MRKQRMGFIFKIIMLCLFLFGVHGYAIAEQDYVHSGKYYELPENSNYDYTGKQQTNVFFYGASKLGALHVKGAIQKVTEYGAYTAYGATGDITLQYSYNGSFQKQKDESWHIESDGERWPRDYDLGFLNNMGMGCIMIEKSYPGESWKKVIDPIKNYFDKAKTSTESIILTIPEEDYKNGAYYRVVVAYKFAKKLTSTFLGVSDEYDRRKCVEVYQFYVSSERNYITLTDLGTRYQLKDRASTDAGFMIRRNGSNATVTVNDDTKNLQDFEYFAEPGEYKIWIKTDLGKQYSYSITVTNGLDFTSLSPTVYDSEKDKGFPLSKTVAKPVFGENLTSLSIVTPKGFAMSRKDYIFGITGNEISIYLKINRQMKTFGAAWQLTADTWGKNKNQLVCDVETGEVGKGALIVQTSSNGKNWKRIDQGRYERGLYTTDFTSHYKMNENIKIYTPSGQDIINGVYIRVLFAYQVKRESKNEYHDYVESYMFYLCSNELGAVTFHNLSVKDTLKDSFTDEEQNDIEVYQQAETLVDGSYTTTGFKIDRSRNQTVSYSVHCDGELVSSDKDTFDKSGKYDIKLTSKVGSIRELTIYVDRLKPEKAMKRYFGDGFISGKRIFSEGDYPVYEAGETSYYVAGVNNKSLPLYGQIRNLTTGSVITIEQNEEKKTGIISEPGNYQATFATSQKYFTNELAGDARVFTFRFLVIAQGTAPGPVINKKLLDEYSHSAVTDCNPVYYGLTYLSAEKGKITLAFATKEAAMAYAYKVEEGLVEKQENGEYRYSGAFVVDQNIKFESAWDLTRNLNYYAEAAVHRHFFNMADEFTYLSMTDEDIEKYPNLRQLELTRSVTLFGENQKRQLTDIEALPLLNDKPYAYLDPATGLEDRGTSSFQFVSDQYGGIDSSKVQIIDSKGVQHDIRYSESVGQQLLAQNCPSGIVTIHEETMYGDATEYQAVYIAPNDNQTELTMEYTLNEEAKSMVFNGAGPEEEIIADEFTIKGLSDPLDPYAFVIVKHHQIEEAFTAKENLDIVWSKPGRYTITCLNRMGYGYTVPITVGSAEEAMLDDQAFASDFMTSDPYHSSSQGTKRNVPEEEKKGSNAGTIIIVVGLLLLAGLGVSSYKKIKLFSRATRHLKGEEEKGHE